MEFRRFVRRFIVSCTFAAMAASLTHSGSASESLRPSLAKIAEAVAKIAESRGGGSVAIGQFTGPPTLQSNAGPGIQKVLTDELANNGVRIAKFNADLGIRGEYLYTSAESSPNAVFKQIRLKVVLTDGSGQALTSLNRDIDLNPSVIDDESIDVDPAKRKIKIRDGAIDLDTLTGGADAAELLGVTWDFERNGLGLDLTKDVVADSFANPMAQIVNGTAVRSSPTSPYFVEVFVGSRPLPLRLEDGQPTVNLSKGQTFVLRVTNRASHDVSAAVALDGVNSFAFSRERGADGRPLARYVIGRNRPMWIKGWHETFASNRAFSVATFSAASEPNPSPAAQFGTESSLGMITVVIRGSWQAHESPPPDEPGQNLVESAAPEAAPGLATTGLPDAPAADVGPLVPGNAVFPTQPTLDEPPPVVSRTPTSGPSFPEVEQTRGAPIRAGTGTINEPGSPDESADAGPLAIVQGKKQSQESHATAGRQKGVVRSIITIRYDR